MAARPLTCSVVPGHGKLSSKGRHTLNERWKGDIHRLGAGDAGAAVNGAAGHSHRHNHAVIAVALDVRRLQIALPDDQAGRLKANVFMEA